MHNRKFIQTQLLADLHDVFDDNTIAKLARYAPWLDWSGIRKQFYSCRDTSQPLEILKKRRQKPKEPFEFFTGHGWILFAMGHGDQNFMELEDLQADQDRYGELLRLEPEQIERTAQNDEDIAAFVGNIRWLPLFGLLTEELTAAIANEREVFDRSISGYSQSTAEESLIGAIFGVNPAYARKARTSHEVIEGFGFRRKHFKSRRNS